MPAKIDRSRAIAELTFVTGEVAGSSGQPTGAKYLMLTPTRVRADMIGTCSLLATQLLRCSRILRVLTSQVAKLRSEVTPDESHDIADEPARVAQHDGTARAAPARKDEVTPAELAVQASAGMPHHSNVPTRASMTNHEVHLHDFKHYGGQR